MIKLRGYIFSRSFMGERVPQNIQNLVLRDYCKKKNYQYLLSFSEYAMEGSSAMLYDAVCENDSQGIIAYSVFQLPSDEISRFDFYKKIIKRKKTIHFALEDMKISNESEIPKIEETWFIKKSLDQCNITNERLKKLI